MLGLVHVRVVFIVEGVLEVQGSIMLAITDWLARRLVTRQILTPGHVFDRRQREVSFQPSADLQCVL